MPWRKPTLPTWTGFAKTAPTPCSKPTERRSAFRRTTTWAILKWDNNAIGAGRRFPQGARLVNEAIASGHIFEGKGWQRLVDYCREHHGTFHFIGLFSSGNVHSNLDHVRALLQHLAYVDRVPWARVHILLDGRDVGETSAFEFLFPFEAFLKELNDRAEVDYRIASGGGRMKITMDRYEADWTMVERGWKTHVAGKGREFESAEEAIRTYRVEDPGVIDQDLPPFVIVDAGGPVGRIQDGDSVLYFNFRGDRAIEISRAFEEESFDKFERVPNPKVAYEGMLEYDTELHIPRNYLVEPPAIDHVMGEYLVELGIRQLALSETQKFGHVTYFWNGNRSGQLDEELEKFIEIPSDKIPFEQRPWMKAAEITDTTIAAIRSNNFDFIRLNYPNGDMVGHTGVYPAARIAVETVDLSLGRLMKAVKRAGGLLLITADHGNADEMYEIDKKTGKAKCAPDGCPKAKTAHTLNPVWFIVYDPSGENSIRIDPEVTDRSLTNIAATCFQLLGFEPPEIFDPPLLILGEM